MGMLNANKSIHCETNKKKSRYNRWSRIQKSTKLSAMSNQKHQTELKYSLRENLTLTHHNQIRYYFERIQKNHERTIILSTIICNIGIV